MPAPSPVPAARVAVLIPCLNEAAAIGAVVRGFRAALPHAAILVYDNGSTDGTAAVAREAGARTRTEHLRGKGHVIRRMFADVDADAYLLVDGDGTYDPASAPLMIDMLLRERLDMVTGVRVSDVQEAYRPGHRLGNRVLTGLVAAVFGDRVTDMLSGYRAFSRRFVKSFPALAQGFETETEFTVHALELRMALGEVRTPYSERAAGSQSKLNTWRDGWRILRTITRLVREERPLPFFSACAAVLLLLAAATGARVVTDYLRTGLVPRLPSAVLATGLVLLAALSLFCGLVLSSVTRARQEMKRLTYLAVPLHEPDA